MFEQTLAIIRNTFFESIRQPIMLVLLVVATLAIILSNPLSAFTMDQDQRMVVDLGLSTIFLCGTLLAAMIATSVLTREIENKTALTVVSKPVSRVLFILGKYLGVAAAIGLGMLYMSLVFMMVEMHGALQTVRDPVHVPVILFGVGATLLGVGIGVWCNYFYGMVFASSVIVATTPLLLLAYILALFFKADFTTQPIDAAFRPQIWLALITLSIAVLVLASVAIAASARLNQILTIVVTLGVFMLGLLSNWLFGGKMSGLEATWLQRASDAGQTRMVEIQQTVILATEESRSSPKLIEIAKDGVDLNTFAQGGEQAVHALSRVGYTVVPNFDLQLLTDAVTQGHLIPVSYVANVAIYGGLYITAMLALGVILFQRREVG